MKNLKVMGIARVIAMAVAAAVFLASCATKYQGNDGFTGGFDEARLDQNAFRVTFEGNGYTSPERAQDMALLRSADLALQNGFSYFIVVGADGRISSSTFVTPTYSTTTGTVRSYGSTAYVQGRTNTYGGQAINIEKPRYTMTILCFHEHERPDPGTMVYRARFVYDSLALKYEINKPK